MTDLPSFVWKLIRNANFQDGDGGGGDDGGGATGSDAGGSEGDATGGTAGGTAGEGGATGAGAGASEGGSVGAGGGGAAEATAGGGTSGVTGGGIGGAPGDAPGIGAVEGFSTATTGPFGTDPGGLGFAQLGGPDPTDPGSPGFGTPLSSQGDFLQGGLAPVDLGAFAGVSPGTIGSNPGFGFGPGDITSLTFGEPDPTAEMAGQAWPTGTVGAPPVATAADLDQLANPGTVPTGSLVGGPTTSQIQTGLEQIGTGKNFEVGGIFGDGIAPTTATDSQGGISGGGGLDIGQRLGGSGNFVVDTSPSPLGLGVLGTGAGTALGGILSGEGGVQLATGEVVPEPDSTLTSDQIAQFSQQEQALLDQWSQIINPSDPRWQQVLDFVRQQIWGGAAPGLSAMAA